MLSDLDNPRPLPPAKARRATSMTAKANSTPPPAYGSTFMFPSRNNTPSGFGADILNTPRQLMAAWDTDSPSSSVGYESPRPEDLEWMNETSREELHELLLKANGIIKEREQELDMATNMVKRVYGHNSILKSKHEAFLAKIPMSSSPSQCPSPNPLSKSMHLSHSVSESNLPDPLKTHARKVSIAVADISLLADQNAELLSKLQKLEEDATSTDIAGRRELRRLEKEIIYLRDALEKTQAKSEELEGKVQSAVTSEAVRRKKEREAIRNAAKSSRTEVTVLDFAPPGSKFGGPSERFSLLDLPKEDSPIRNGFGSPLSCDPDYPDDEVASDQILISRLLNKVKELEEANERILCQQAETANQIAHVQQDTLNMTKVYELLSDHDAVQLELEPEDGKRPSASDKSEIPTIRFKSLRRSMENSISENGSFMFPETTHTTRARKTVLGLFGEQDAKVETKIPNGGRSMHRDSPADLFEGTPQSSSMSSLTPSSTGQQSPLPFFSPVPQSDHLHGRTLQNELESMIGQGSWNLSGPNHMRTASLSNLSLFSAPSTPSPAPGSSSRVLPEEMESGCDSGLQTPRRTSEPLPAEKVLRLSVEPPSPDVVVERTIVAQKHASRLQDMSRTLRSRKTRWVERMSYDGKSQQVTATSLTPRRRTPSLHQQLSNVVDGITDNVDDSEGSKRSSSGDAPSQMTTPRAWHGVEYEDTQTTVRRAEDKSFLFQVWLWFQFAIVVIFFIFAMARKGPGSLLGQGGAEGVRKERRVVARR